jgi:hypothetical protein
VLDNSTFEITNAMGQSIMTGQVNHDAKINVSNLPDGIYIIKYINGTNVASVVKFVKQ